MVLSSELQVNEFQTILKYKLLFEDSVKKRLTVLSTESNKYMKIPRLKCEMLFSFYLKASRFKYYTHSLKGIKLVSRPFKNSRNGKSLSVLIVADLDF